MKLSTYKRFVEAILAEAIIKLHGEPAPLTRDWLTEKIDILSTSLRSTGGYGTTAFDLAWASEPSRRCEVLRKAVEDFYRANPEGFSAVVAFLEGRQ